MIAAGAIQRYEQSGGQGNIFYTQPGNIIMNGMKGMDGFPKRSRAMPAVTFGSYAELKKALDSGRLSKDVKAVLYDNEAWEFTPPEEQQDIAKFEKLAADAVHSHGLLFVATPATDLTRILSPQVKTRRYDEYLRLGIAGAAAQYADIYEIQAQGSEDNLAVYTQFVKQAAAQARAANPQVKVFAGLSTNPSGKHVTAKGLYDAIMATRSDVDGYWLNIPAGGSHCPRCGEAQPQVAVELIKMLDAK
jgi:hypothetical protein